MNHVPIGKEIFPHLNVGIVVVNWNSYEILAQCLSSLSKQTRSFARVVVVDNGSEPQLKHLTCARPENTEYVKLHSNTGFAKANNIAIDMLHDCAWIALVNPDAILEQDWVEQMVLAIHKFPQCSFFSGMLMQARAPSLFDSLGDVYHTSGLAWRGSYGWARNQVSVSECEIFSPCAAAAIYRREALLEVGGFDEDYFCYYEDVDLGFRLRLAGHCCMLVPGAVAYHAGSSSSGGSSSDFVIFHGHRNLVWTFVKNMPGHLFWMYLPQHIALNFVNIIRLILRGKGTIILSAKWNAIKGFPVMWRKRTVIQANKKIVAAVVLRQMEKGLGSILSRTPPNRS